MLEDGPHFNEGVVELKAGGDLKLFFKRADRALGYGRRGPFRAARAFRVPPTILLNGDRLDLPEGWSRVLQDGDEITVLSPMSGG